MKIYKKIKIDLLNILKKTNRLLRLLTSFIHVHTQWALHVPKGHGRSKWPNISFQTIASWLRAMFF